MICESQTGGSHLFSTPCIHGVELEFSIYRLLEKAHILIPAELSLQLCQTEQQDYVCNLLIILLPIWIGLQNFWHCRYVRIYTTQRGEHVYRVVLGQAGRGNYFITWFFVHPIRRVFLTLVASDRGAEM